MKVSRSIAEHHSTLAKSKSNWSDRWVYLLAASGMASIIIYGSLLPFDLKAPNTLDPRGWQAQIRVTASQPASRTDVFLNVATGVPLGFLLMGALRSGRPRSHVGRALALLVVGCVSITLGTTVELLQLLSATRISSLEDALAQVLGAGLGALAWAVAGPTVTLWLHRMVNHHESFEFAERLLQLYLPIYLIMQLTGLDVEFATKYPERQIPQLPFAHYFEFSFPVLRNVAAHALLNVPIGALAVLHQIRKGVRRPLLPAVLFGVLIVIAIAIAQGFISSHYADVINILSGALGVAIGIAAAVEWARTCASDHGGRSLRLNLWLLVAAGGWTLVPIAEYLYPFDFQLTLEILKARLPYIPLIPFESYYPAYSADPLDGLREVLRRFLLAVPLGLLLRMAWPVAGNIVTTGIATIVLLGIAIAEIFVPSGYPDITEVLIGAAGAALGAQLARRSPGHMSGGGVRP